MRELVHRPEPLATTEPIMMELRAGAHDAALTRVERIGAVVPSLARESVR